MTTDKRMNRRAFIKRSGGAAAGAAAMGGLGMSVNAWAATLDNFDMHAAKTLLAMSKQIFPHPSLGDMYYANVVRDLDDDASDNPDTAKLLNDGIKALDAGTQVNWVDLSHGYQLDALKAIESDAFFQAVKGKAIVSIYNNPLVWRELGYEGASAHLGGYINRGFDDLGWLGQPSEEASPRDTTSKNA